MRIGLIADVHGNLVALDTVLAELDREPVDRLVCLGDVAALGPQPRKVIARLREAGCPSVLGNTDAWLLEEPPRPTDPAEEAMSGISRWCAERLSAEDLAYLRACPPTLRVSLGDGNAGMPCFHGSPRSHDEVVSAITPDGELSEMLSGPRASVFAGGHTHVQLFRCHGEARVINPGGVGLLGVGLGTPDLPVNRGWPGPSTRCSRPKAGAWASTCGGCRSTWAGCLRRRAQAVCRASTGGRAGGVTPDDRGAPCRRGRRPGRLAGNPNPEEGARCSRSTP